MSWSSRTAAATRATTWTGLISARRSRRKMASTSPTPTHGPAAFSQHAHLWQLLLNDRSLLYQIDDILRWTSVAVYTPRTGWCSSRRAPRRSTTKRTPLPFAPWARVALGAARELLTSRTWAFSWLGAALRLGHVLGPDMVFPESTRAGSAVLSGRNRKFVWCSDPGGGVIEVETAGAVEGVFGSAGEQAGRQDRILVVVVAGAVDREAPAGC